MAKIATKKATAQLQKIFNYLGEFGGTIETNQPRTWWTLDLEVESVDGKEKDIQIGIFSTMNGDVIFDPVFYLTLTVEDGKILEAKIKCCEESTLFGTTVVDENDMLHGFGQTEKDPYGLRKRFSNFMENMTKVGPYLTEPKAVTRYEKTLADF